MDCKNQFVHFCPLDEENKNITENSHDINDIFISQEGIRNIMKKLEPTAACGPEGIPAVLLKHCPDSLDLPVTLLWRKSFEVGYDPERLKGAYIFPNLKFEAQRTDPSGWHPISHTSQLSLIFERYVKEILVNHIENYGLMGPHQYGFRKKRPCLAQLLQFYENVL